LNRLENSEGISILAAFADAAIASNLDKLILLVCKVNFNWIAQCRKFSSRRNWEMTNTQSHLKQIVILA
jgi:hypothetical protein